MGFEGLGDSMRSPARVALKKERERRKKDARAPTPCIHYFFMSYPPPETTHSLILKTKASEGSSMKIPSA